MKVKLTAPDLTHTVSVDEDTIVVLYAGRTFIRDDHVFPNTGTKDMFSQVKFEPVD